MWYIYTLTSYLLDFNRKWDISQGYIFQITLVNPFLYQTIWDGNFSKKYFAFQSSYRDSSEYKSYMISVDIVKESFILYFNLVTSETISW